MTLWDSNDLLNHLRERPQPYNNSDIVASESIEDKSSALSVDASLKASFLSGLVEVSGSAKYLNDSKSSKNKARVTLKYKATTKIQELSMDHLGRRKVKHPYVFKKGLATHVVTQILYGAQAFFVFDREVSEQENHQDVQGNLKVMIKKIPSLSIEGQGSLKMEDRDKANVHKFSCRFYGDFCLPEPPTTFQDAVAVYQSLPKLLETNGEKAVPVKVWLLPLATLDSDAAKLVRQISIGLVHEAQRVLEDLSELEMRCNDALRTSTAQQFPQIGKKLKSFKEMCCEFKLEFQQTLVKKLPSIRGGGEEEAELAEILKKRHSSPFSSNNLTEWMDCKEREIYTVMSLINLMKNTKIISSQIDLYKQSLGAEHAVCFVFTSVGKEEPYLSALSKYLEGTTSSDLQGPHSYDVEQEQWYASREVADKMRKKVKLFSDFAEANKENKNMKFLIVGITNETQEGSSIYLYKDGFAVSENFEPPSKPETVTAANINHNSVTLKISPPRFGAESITSYSAEYCVSGEDGWQQQTEAKAEDVTVRDLKPNTEYMFRCRAVTSAGVGPAHQVSIRTSPCSPAGKTVFGLSEEAAEKLRHQSMMIRSDPPSVYMLPLTEEHMDISRCRRFRFGKESSRQNRTIMLVGAVGSGKSTLINGMINYILGVQWEDPHRFKLVDEDSSASQAQSQTSEVTVYKIHHQDGFTIPFSLTIIDTPGFGDTRGIDRDREIVEQIYRLFSSQHGVSVIDAVCFVAQAALAQLTPTQKYVFDSVLSMFGKDMAENIRVLVTFADGQKPPVLEAIKAAGVPCPKTKDGIPAHFKFNNSALFANNKSAEAGSTRDDDEEGGFDKMFWDMGSKSMKRFFNALNLIETKRLTMTKEVLRERNVLEISVENLQVQVKLGLAKLEEIKETSDKLKEHEAEISRNENFELEVIIKKPVQEDISRTGNYITNCQQCHVTCHYPCPIANDADKRRCAAIGSNGYCTECPGKCYWNVHFNQKYSWRYEEVKEKRSIKELKEKYQRATGEKMIVQRVMDNLKDEYKRLEAEVVKMIQRSAECLNRLEEIALKPNPLSTPEYIDMLIKGEKSEGKPGWKQRVQALMSMKEKAETMAKVEKGEKLLNHPGFM